MQKNWYIVYTKPGCEKKVAALLTKRRIENFCPLNFRHVRHLRKSKMLYEPLFTSYVFVNLGENGISLLKQVSSVISLVYWKAEFAVIKEEEIEAIKEFTTHYQDIKLERAPVNENGQIKIADAHTYTINGKILNIKNKGFKMNLPSLGFTLVADMKAESSMDREISFGDKKRMLQPQP